MSTSREGYVYIVRCENGLHKIGIAQDVSDRMKDFASLPFSVELIHTIRADDAMAVERNLHRTHRHCRVLGEWFNLSFAVVEGLKKIDYVPASMLHSDPDERSVVVLSPEDEQRYRDAVVRSKAWGAVRDHALVGMILDAGLGRHELHMLDRRDVDLERGVIHVRNGKHGGERVVPLPTGLSDALRTYLAERGDPDPALFLSQRSGRISVRGIDLIIGRYAREAGLAEVATSVALRHTFALRFLERTGDVEQLRQVLGLRTMTMIAGYLRAQNAA